MRSILSLLRSPILLLPLLVACPDSSEPTESGRDADASVDSPAVDAATVVGPDDAAGPVAAPTPEPEDAGAPPPATDATMSRSRPTPGLALLDNRFPKAFFFRITERTGGSYEAWAESYGRLMGIEGKLLREEQPYDLEERIAFFRRFEEEHPEQAVILHFNGNARDPSFPIDPELDLGRYFTGHWIHYVGAETEGAAEAGERESVVKVSDTSRFATDVGNYDDREGEASLCRKDDGKPDWNTCESVSIVAVYGADHPNRALRSSVRIRRGQHGTFARRYPRGSYLAQHTDNGPWGRMSNLLWHYNYALDAPRDELGRSAADILVAELAGLLGEGGRLSFVDGIALDILYSEVGARGFPRDLDGDGEEDSERVRDRYGHGVYQFLSALRAALPDKLILADGQSPGSQRGFHFLNGTESEGWPDTTDGTVRYWDAGLNRLRFPQAFGARPFFGYVNQKYSIPLYPDAMPSNIHRLVMATATIHRTAFTYSRRPPDLPSGQVAIWDELVAGTDQEPGWLGRPVRGGYHRLATQSRNFMGATRSDRLAAVSDMLDAAGVVHTDRHDRGWLRVEAQGGRSLDFDIPAIPAKDRDLLITLTMFSPAGSGRYPRRADIGIVRRGRHPARTTMTWLGQREFEASVYVRDAAAPSVGLRITVDGDIPLVITDVSAYGQADVTMREFENGLVLVNPSDHPFTIPLWRLLPGKSYRRIQGTEGQDTRVNDGRPVGGNLTVGPLDGLFLRRVP